MFWAAVCELAPFQVRNLLRALLPEFTEDAQRDGILFGKVCAERSTVRASNDNMNVAIHILPPTAVAMLSADACEITLFPDRMALALPRYTSIRVVTQQLLRVVNASN
jgi:hypothetical protein